MKRTRGIRSGAITFAAICAGTLTVSIALAQPPGGQDGGAGGPPPGGQFGGPGRGPGGGMGMRQLTVLDVPAATLKEPLTLTDDQTTKIAAIQKKINAQRDAMRQNFRGGPGGQGGPGGPGGPPPNGPNFAPGDQNDQLQHGGPNAEFGQDPGQQGGPPPGGGFGPGGQGGPGGPGGPGQFRSNPQEQAAIKSIEAILTDTQKTKLPTVLKQFGGFQMAGIPLEATPALKLTAAQRTKIAAVTDAARESTRKAMDEARQSGDFSQMREIMQNSREAVHDQVVGILSSTQYKALSDWMDAHPQRGPGFGPPGGGPGGPGGPPQDGNGPPQPPQF